MILKLTFETVSTLVIRSDLLVLNSYCPDCSGAWKLNLLISFDCPDCSGANLNVHP